MARKSSEKKVAVSRRGVIKAKDVKKFFGTEAAEEKALKKAEKEVEKQNEEGVDADGAPHQGSEVA